MLSGQELDPEQEEGSQFDTMADLVKKPVPICYNPAIPIETFDFIWTDECHRSIYNLWRQVLEYFDAHLIGLTAPLIRTRITEQGSTVEAGEYDDKRDRETRAVRWEQFDEELSYDGGSPRPRRGVPRPDPHGRPHPQGGAVHRDLPWSAGSRRRRIEAKPVATSASSTQTGQCAGGSPPKVRGNNERGGFQGPGEAHAAISTSGIAAL